jgi:hypothetical protein
MRFQANPLERPERNLRPLVREVDVKDEVTWCPSLEAGSNWSGIGDLVGGVLGDFTKSITSGKK